MDQSTILGMSHIQMNQSTILVRWHTRINQFTVLRGQTVVWLLDFSMNTFTKDGTRRKERWNKLQTQGERIIISKVPEQRDRDRETHFENEIGCILCNKLGWIRCCKFRLSVVTVGRWDLWYVMISPLLFSLQFEFRQILVFYSLLLSCSSPNRQVFRFRQLCRMISNRLTSTSEVVDAKRQTFVQFSLLCLWEK